MCVCVPPTPTPPPPQWCRIVKGSPALPPHPPATSKHTMEQRTSPSALMKSASHTPVSRCTLTLSECTCKVTRPPSFSAAWAKGIHRTDGAGRGLNGGGKERRLVSTAKVTHLFKGWEESSGSDGRLGAMCAGGEGGEHFL